MELLQPGESSRLMVESDFNKKLKTLSQIALKELKEIINNERHLIPQEIQPYIELLLQKQ